MGTLSSDFVAMSRTLSEAGVEYLLIGAHALAAHGVVRFSQDIDFWVRPTPDNAERVFRALAAFGAPLAAHNVVPADFATRGTVYQIGVKPFRIDILTSVSGLEFEDAWAERVPFDLDGTAVFVPSVKHLVQNKRASGRLKDLADVEALEQIGMETDGGASR